MRNFIDGCYPYTGTRAASAPVVTDYVEDVVLAADTLVRVPIPAHASFVLFSFDGDVRAKVGTAETSFALPTVTSADGTGSILNPGARRIPDDPAATHVCLRAPATCKGSIEFYS